MQVLNEKQKQEQDLVQAQLEHSNTEKIVSQIEEQIQKHTNALPTLKASLLATQKEMDRLQAEFSQKQQEIDNIEKEKTQKEKELQAYTTERSTLKRKLVETQSKFDKVQAKFQRLLTAQK